MIENTSGLTAFGFGAILLLLLAAPAVCQEVLVAPGGSPGGVIDLQGGSPASSINLTVLGNFEDWNLDIGPNQNSIPLQVEASGSWQVEAADASSLGGRMTKYSSSEGYDPSVQLADSLKLSSPNQPGFSPVDLATGGVIATGSATGTSLLNVPVIIEQQVALSDQPLDENHKYRILVTFTGSLTS